MYDYRNMLPEERERIVAYRRECSRPLHAPPHREAKYTEQFLLTATCYEHARIIDKTLFRISQFETDLLNLFREFAEEIYSRCVLPNHYHVLSLMPDLNAFMPELGKLHGRTSYHWNREDSLTGRKVWHRAFDREIRSEGHFWPTMNYVHNNTVHHGYVEKWTDWPWSNAAEYLESVGREKAIRIWFDYPVRDCGKGWDL